MIRSTWTSMRNLMLTILKTIKDLSYFLLVLLLFVFIYTVRSFRCPSTI